MVQLVQQLQPLEELRCVDMLYNLGVSGTLCSFVLGGMINKILNCRDLSGNSAKLYLPPPMEY